MELLDADWLSEGPIRLNDSLSLNDLSGCLVLNHARFESFSGTSRDFRCGSQPEVSDGHKNVGYRG